MRVLYILLAIALIITTSCNKKPVRVQEINVPTDTLIEHEETDSIEVFEDSLAYWTYDEIVRQHGELVDVAQYIWRMNRNDTVSQNLDLIMKEVKRINPILVTYFDRHHKAKNFNKEQKIDSVLNEIEVEYKIMLGGTTMSIMVGFDVCNAVDSYRGALLYDRMMQMAKNEKLRVALRDEMVKWKAFECDLSSYLASIATLCYWGGSLAGPARFIARQGVLKSRIDDQKNIYTMLFETKSREKSVNLNQAETHFQQSLKQALDSVFYENHSESYDHELDSQYMADYKEAQYLQSDAKNTLTQWLNARKHLGQTAKAEQDENKSWQTLTALFLNKLSQETIKAATF